MIPREHPLMVKQRRQRSPQRPDPAIAVAAWNAKHPVGTAVTLRKDDGEVVEGVTTCAAYVLSGHSAVIFVSGVRGCYLLDRVKAKVADNG